MVINTNIPSAYAARVLSNSTNSLAKALAKLSSGSRIVSPEDDAAGLAQSMKFSAEIGRIGAARSNVGNAISFSQTQDGFMSKVDSALRRMSELATLSADQTKAASDVANYNKEFAELKLFITKSSTKTFNTVGLFSSAELKDTDGADTGATINNIKTELLLKTILDGGTILQSGAAAGGATDNVGGLKGSYDTFIGGPADVSGAGTIFGATGANAGDLWTAAAHGLEDGEKVTFKGATANGVTQNTNYLVNRVSDNTFQLHAITDTALTGTAVVLSGDVTAANGVFQAHGEYGNLTGLRTSMADMAEEWDQHLGVHTGGNVDGSDAYSSNKTWEQIYDFWQGKIGNNWTGVRDHGDTARVTSGAANTGISGTTAGDKVHVGNATAVTDGLIEQYKKLYADIRSYVNNNAAGLEVTDSSDATTFRLKGADVSTITSAISSATDTNAIADEMTKTNAATYVGRISTLINNLAGSRAYVGANISRLNMVESQLAVYGENLSAANSRIADVDVATESDNYAKQQILVQSGTAMLAQANVLSQSALKLL